MLVLMLVGVTICVVYVAYQLHGGEARDLKLDIPGTLPWVRICISLIFSLIMVGFACFFFADNLKKGTKTTYLNCFLEK